MLTQYRAPSWAIVRHRVLYSYSCDRWRLVRRTCWRRDRVSIRREILAKIITDKILNASIQASSFKARYTDQDSIIKNLKIHKLGNKLNVKQVDKWRGKHRRGRGTQQDLSCSDTNLKRVAKLWHECPTSHVGGKDDYIATHMCHDNGTPLYESAQRARQLARALELELIPHSKRSKLKQTKRGSK